MNNKTGVVKSYDNIKIINLQNKFNEDGIISRGVYVVDWVY